MTENNLSMLINKEQARYICKNISMKEYLVAN